MTQTVRMYNAPIPIHTFRARYDIRPYLQKGILSINSHNLKGAWVEYALTHLHRDFVRHEVEIEAILNKDKQGRRKVSYPLLQFHLGVGHVRIVGIAQGATALELWVDRVLEASDFSINNISTSFTAVEEITQHWRPTILQRQSVYHLSHWKPYSPANLKEAKPLHNVLYGQIMRIMDDVGAQLDERPVINILDTQQLERQVPDNRSLQIKWIVYHASLVTNINLPLDIGVGHESRLGYGIISAGPRLI